MSPFALHRRSAWSLASAAVIVSLFAVPAPAVAVPADIVIPMVGGSTHLSWEYESTAIDPQATTLLVDGRAAGGPTVICTLASYSSPPVLSAEFSAEEWNAPGPVELAVPDGTFEEPFPDLTCQSEGAVESWTIYWPLFGEAGGTNSLQQWEDPRLLAFRSSTTFVDPGPARPIAAGSTVVLAGPWDWDADVISAQLTSAAPGVGSIDLPAELVSGGLSVQIPSSLPAGFLGSASTLRASTSTYSDYANSTSWTGSVLVVDTAPSTTSLTLERRFGISRQRLTASARVSSQGGVVAGGTVVFSLNGREIGSSPVDASGRATFLLPRLPRGKHFVTAAFSGADGVLPSSSAASSLRIVI